MIVIAWAIGGWLVGLALLWLAVLALSRAAERHPAVSDRLPAERTTTAERALLTAHHAAIVAVTAHMHCAVPCGILLAALVAGLVWRAYRLSGHVSTAGTLLLVYLVYTLWSWLAAIARRAPLRPPGRPLSRLEAPGLWAEVDAVANRLGARPVDAIYVSPWSEIGVVRGKSLRRALRGAEERYLIIGLGALRNLDVAELRPILAHELAHLLERDLVGGHLAWHLREQIQKGQDALRERGLAGSWHPAWVILGQYERLGRRLTLAVDRYREVVADRYAALYGAERALAAINKQVHNSAVHLALAEAELTEAAMMGRPVRNLYRLPEPSAGADPTFEQRYQAALRASEPPADAHPPLGERTAMLRRLANRQPSPPCEAPAWQLFASPEALQLEMTQVAAATNAAQSAPRAAEPDGPRGLHGIRRG